MATNSFKLLSWVTEDIYDDDVIDTEAYSNIEFFVLFLFIFSLDFSHVLF